MRILRALAWSVATLITVCCSAAQPDRILRIDLAYRAPGNGPRTNFSPYGTQVQLFDLPADSRLPEGATRPARTGTLRIRIYQKSWIKILATADSGHPQDLCRLYIDRNRNDNFDDDGPPLSANPSLNEKTKAWWSSFNGAEMSIPYTSGIVEPYMVNFLREGVEAPHMIRYSVSSWRSGRVTVEGIEALVAVMDADNNAVFDARDNWSVLATSEQDALRRVLSFTEARHTNRMMFLPKGDGKELVLEFRELSPDGRSLSFAVIDRAVIKAQDRAPDDTLASERTRPRTSRPFLWIDADIERGLAEPKGSGRKLILDFWATWRISEQHAGDRAAIGPSLRVRALCKRSIKAKRASPIVGTRPNNTGRSARKTGSVEDRLNQYFDTSVFTAPGPFAFGNTLRTLPDVRRWEPQLRFEHLQEFRAEGIQTDSVPRQYHQHRAIRVFGKQRHGLLVVGQCGFRRCFRAAK